MTYSIQKIAKKYIYERYPRATTLEKEKYVSDWSNKIRDSKSLVDDFKKRVGDPSGKKVLDAGCGNGGISIAFSLAGALAYGVEIERELYEISKDHATSYNTSPEFYLYDGNTLPFADNFFDYAVSASVLEHTDDPILYLSEIFRTLKFGGALYLGFPNKLTPRETHTQLLFLTYLPSVLRPIYIKLFHRNPLPDNNLHFYGYFDLERMIAKINADKDFRINLMQENGSAVRGPKKIIKNILNFFGISYKTFLPHILVILKKDHVS